MAPSTLLLATILFLSIVLIPSAQAIIEPPTVQSDGSNLVITVPNLSSTNSTLKIAYRELQTLMPVCSDFMSEVYPIANRLPFESTIVNAKCNYSYCVAIIQLEQDGDEKDASNPVTISVPCAGSGGPSLTFPILILVSVGGGALLLLTVMTCLALLCLCCKARRIRRGAKIARAQIELVNHTLVNPQREVREEGESEEAESVDISRTGSMTVSVAWHLHNTLRRLETLPEEAVENDEEGEKETQEEEEEKEDFYSDIPELPPLPDRAYLEDRDFVGKLEKEEVSNGAPHLHAHCDTLTVSVDWSMQGHSSGSGSMPEMMSRDGSATVPSTENEIPHSHAAKFSSFGPTLSWLEPPSLPKPDPPEHSSTSARYVGARYGFYPKTQLVSCDDDPSLLNVSTFKSHRSASNPSSQCRPQLPPMPCAVDPPHRHRQTSLASAMLGEPASPATWQKHLEPLVPMYHIPHITVESESRESSSPDPDLPPTWIDRSITMSDSYFPLRPEGSLGSRPYGPLAGQNPMQRTGNERVGNGDAYEEL